MTNPSDQPHRQAPGPPYGPPPQPYGGAPAPRQEWVPPERTDKGLLGALLDANFDHLVTPKLIKLWYVVALLLVTLQCVAFLAFGGWIATWDDWWGFGVIMVISAPLLWLFEMLLVRILMEAVVVRFKTAEHLRVIKDKI
ncbi:DUF4282 domain-containing protein [Spirillospora sp. NPDC029432]|uniref:DUF4282 domain-containing protein n=1 Tax=Spirillospora sp. NPDC029432 TaxID=3154599 RepID=UPI003454A9EE